MRLLMLFFLLMLTACTIRAETFSPRDDANGGLSFTPPDLTTPMSLNDNRPCQGGLARGSDMQDLRGGTLDFFCE